MEKKRKERDRAFFCFLWHLFLCRAEETFSTDHSLESIRVGINLLLQLLRTLTTFDDISWYPGPAEDGEAASDLTLLMPMTAVNTKCSVAALRSI